MATEVLPSTIQNFLSWQAKRYLQLETKEAPPVTGPFITISREYGCEGIPLARGLADRLNQISPGPTPWIVMGKEIIATIAQKKGAAAEFVDALSHSRRGFIQQTVEVLFGHRPTEYQAYETLVETLVTLAEAGRVILVGRGSAIVCGGLARGMHARIIAPLSWRARKISRERGISEGEAEAIAAQQGKGRIGFVRDFTGKDIFDPLNYDFVFNNERNGVDTIVEMIMSAIRQREFV